MQSFCWFLNYEFETFIFKGFEDRSLNLQTNFFTTIIIERVTNE